MASQAKPRATRELLEEEPPRSAHRLRVIAEAYSRQFLSRLGCLEELALVEAQRSSDEHAREGLSPGVEVVNDRVVVPARLRQLLLEVAQRALELSEATRGLEIGIGPQPGRRATSGLQRVPLPLQPWRRVLEPTSRSSARPRPLREFPFRGWRSPSRSRQRWGSGRTAA